MTYYAQIVDNIVTEVVVVSDDIIDGAQFCTDLLGGQWVQTFMDNPNKNYAGIGYTYDAGRDAFIPPKPHASWVLNETTCRWEAPTPMPTAGEGEFYSWDEDTTSWVLNTRE